jgi:hypothetical protein
MIKNGSWTYHYQWKLKQRGKRYLRLYLEQLGSLQLSPCLLLPCFLLILKSAGRKVYNNGFLNGFLA